MTDQPLIIYIFFLLSVIMSVYAILCALKRGQWTQFRRPFLWLQVFLLIWLTGDLIRLLLDSYQQKWIVYRIEYVAVCFIGATWLIFCLRYVETSWLTRRNLCWLLLLPSFSYFAVLTNDFHHLFLTSANRNFDQFGILFYVHVIGSYLYCMIGITVLLEYSFKQFKPLRKQASLLIAACLTPLILNYLIIFKVISLNNFDFTPISFNVSSLIFIVGIFKYKFLDIIPVALRKIFDYMGDAIVVCDDTNRIIEYNDAFIKTFPQLARIKSGDSINLLYQVLLDQGLEADPVELFKLDNYSDQSVNIELNLKSTRQYFQSNIQLIRSGRETLGRIITFYDITKYKRLLEEVDRKNSELTVLNRQLREYVAAMEEKVVAKERNRLTGMVRDSLEKNLVNLATVLDICRKSFTSNPQGDERMLEEVFQFAIRCQEEARQALYGLAFEKNDDTEPMEG
jgi:PAS domain-containing protein